MKKTLLLITFIATIGVVSAQVSKTIRILPAPDKALLDQAFEGTVKHIPLGGQLLLTVNEGEDMGYFDIQWYKDGELMPGETRQTLSYPAAYVAHAGVYSVSLSNPCRTVMSKPMHVVVTNEPFQVNTRIPRRSDDGIIAGEGDVAATKFEITRVQPNPVEDKTTIHFTTALSGHVQLRVVDINGAVIAHLVNMTLPAGNHEVMINTHQHNMASGLYYAVMNSNGHTHSFPIVVGQ